MLSTLIIISLILCICCYKWRVVASTFLYMEICIRFCAVFIPNASNEGHTDVYLTMVSIIMFMSFYCDRLGHLIVATLHLAFAIFFGVHVVYKEEITAG